MRFSALAASALFATSTLAAGPHLELDVVLDSATRQFHAQAQLDAPADASIALHRSLAITSASVEGKSVAFEMTGSSGELRLWHVAAAAGAPLHLEYRGVLPALDRAIDSRGVLQALPPMAAQEGSVLLSGSGWYPRPAARFSYRVALSLPAGQRGLVPGRLLEERLPRRPDGHYVAKFAFEHPADGIDLMAGPYEIREKKVMRIGAAPLRLRTYFYHDLAPLADAYLADTAGYIARYEKEIGEYPFSEFSIVASPLPTGFGMATLTYLGAQVLKLPFIRATSLGHEVLHNWWGNGVYVDYERGNWSEGLTTFMADYAYKEGASPEQARAMRLGWLRDDAAVPATERTSLADFRSRAHGAAAAVGYGKSAMVFLMLRDLIGRDAFEGGVRLFWRAQRFRSASWDDLRRAFEESSGRSLKTFFAQWIDRAGAPHVRIESAIVHGGQDGSRLEVTLTQSAPPYKLRVPIDMVTAEGSQTRTVDLDRIRQTVTLPAKDAPEGLRLDPELRLWRVLDPGQLPPILRQWMLASTPRVALVSPALQTDAMALAGSMFENTAEQISLGQARGGTQPVLLVGTQRDIDSALATLGLPPRPARLADRGTAQVWTVRREAAGPPIAVVSARDAAALRLLERPLPHYGAQSFLAFEGARAIERGVWDAPGHLIPVTR
ncbi:MAG: M1 family aminopeptidase [Burkholderiales bacterium]